jgi:hypothetical protein
VSVPSSAPGPEGGRQAGTRVLGDWWDSAGWVSEGREERGDEGRMHERQEKGGRKVGTR